MTTATVSPMSEKQLRFINQLLVDRTVPEDYRFQLQETIDLLDIKQASSVISKLLSFPPRSRQAALPGGAEHQQFVEEDGMYRNPDNGTIYKVQFNRASGDGRRLYAKLLVIEHDAVRNEDDEIIEGAKVRFDYAAGAMRDIQPGWKMTLEDAKQFGALYGTCVRCGRTLTLEVSIERSMGPVCAKAFAR